MQSKQASELKRQAQRVSSNLIGDSRNRHEAIAQPSASSNMNGNTRGVTVNPSTRKLTIVIENKTNTSKLVPLFDANGRFAKLPEAEVGISYDGFTEMEVKNMLLTQPFTIAGLRYRYGDEEQLDQQFVIDEKRGEETTTSNYDPSLHEDPSAEKAIIEDTKFLLLAHAGTALKVPIAPATFNEAGDTLIKARKVKLTFNIATSVDTANTLLGNSAVEKHGQGFQYNDDRNIF